jgi:hypothetical protein
MKITRLLLFLPLIIFVVSPVLANLGVGTGTGKIIIEEALKPGMIHTLPSLSIVSTGDEASGYAVGVEYFGDQPELKPDKEWFTFKPQEFYLEPGESQTVSVRINLPLKPTPGKYFAFLEGFPIRKDVAGETAIGISAATKLYFTIAPQNILGAIYHFTVSNYKLYTPWSNVIAFLILFAVLLTLFKKFFNFNISIKKKTPPEESKD